MTLDAWIVDTVRTPRTRAGKGALAGVKPVYLVTPLLSALRERHALSTDAGDLILGCVTAVNGQGANIARMAALCTDWPLELPGMTVNRFCCSGLDALHIAATQLHAGTHAVVLAGGVESLSQVPMFSDRGAWFADDEIRERTRFVHMAVAADRLAKRQGIRRADIDAFALESHAKARQSIASGVFTGVIPLEGGIACDDGPRVMTLDQLSQLPPVVAGMAPAMIGATINFDPLHSVATSPMQTDGAALVLLATRQACERAGVVPRARIRACASAAADASDMLTGHVVAIRALLERTGLGVDDVDVFEINESFAASVIHAARTLNIPFDRLNPLGGALALGHPLGATGAVLVGQALEALEQRRQQRAIVAIPGGAGVGVAMLLERFTG